MTKFSVTETFINVCKKFNINLTIYRGQHACSSTVMNIQEKLKIREYL